MIAMRSLLVAPAEQAGIKLPPDIHNFDHEEYPYWAVFCNMQLGRPIPSMIEHWENAKLIAGIPDDKIKVMTNKQIEDLGYA